MNSKQSYDQYKKKNKIDKNKNIQIWNIPRIQNGKYDNEKDQCYCETWLYSRANP